MNKHVQAQSGAGLKIIYEDANLLVADKPAGMPVAREGAFSEGTTVAEELTHQYPELLKLGEECRYGLVHRLDKDTSGVLLVAKTKESFRYFQEQFRERKAEKTYLCLVTGTLKEKEGVIEGKLGRSPNDRRKQKVFADTAPSSAREAITRYKILEEFPEFTLLEVSPKTGRRHQIRAHLAFIHHPIAGDKLYGFKNQPIPKGLERQFLHASSLRVRLKGGLPAQAGKEKEFRSELPKDLQNALNMVRATTS